MNVLYAVGVLGKGKNKQVFITDQSVVPQDDFLEQVEQAEADLQDAKSRLRGKKKQLAELMRHQLCYKRVLKRNEKLNAKLKIKMPFLIAQVPKLQSHLQMKPYSPYRMELISETPFKCLGDVDVLKLLGMGEVY